MPQDAFTLRLNALELDSALKGGKINKIVQPEREEVSLVIYTGKRTVKLVLNVNASDCGVYFSDADRENPLVAPNFCMLLRKHLQNAEILGVETVGFERILALHFSCVSDFSSCERVLYAEIMGKYSNLILTEQGTILGALKTTSLDRSTKRLIFPGAKYLLPAPQEKVDPADFSALSALLSPPCEDLARFLFLNVAGLAPCTAEEIVTTYRGGDFAKYVYGYLFSDEISPCVVERDGKVVDFYARAKEGGIPFPTLSEAQTYFYRKRREAKGAQQAKTRLSSALSAAEKKQEKRLAQILEKRKECENAEENRVKGELLTANLYALEKGLRGCELENYYDGRKLKIALDPSLTPSENAQRYYAKYRKQKRTLAAIGPQEEETRAELAYLSSLRAALEVADGKEDLLSLEEECTAAGLLRAPQTKAKKKQPEIPYRVFEYAGFRIFAGRTNIQNDRLLRQSAPEDIWLHAQKYHSSHVVIKTEGRKVPDSVLTYAAGVCAKYSEGKGDRIPVDYCAVKYVKKPSGAKAGFVVYTDYKTVLARPVSD